MNGRGERINVAARCSVPTTGRGALLFGSVFVALSIPLLLMALRVVPAKLDRGVPFWVVQVVATCFVAAGLVFMANGLRQIRRLGRRRRALLERPDEPWFADHAWDPDRVHDDNPGRLARGTLASVFVVAFIAPFNWLAFLSDAARPLLYFAIGFLDLAVGLGLLTIAVWVLRVLRFGRGYVRFGAFPLRLSSMIELTFGMRSDLRTFDAITFRLRCAQEAFDASGSGEHTNVKTNVYELFGVDRTVDAADLGTGGEVRLVFELPDDIPVLTDLSSRPPRYWELDVHARQSLGLDYKARFPLPVYLPAEPARAAPLPEPLAVT